MQTLRLNNSFLERIHIQVAYEQCSTMPMRFLDVPNLIRKRGYLGSLIILAPVALAYQMSRRKEEFRPVELQSTHSDPSAGVSVDLSQVECRIPSEKLKPWRFRNRFEKTSVNAASQSLKNSTVLSTLFSEDDHVSEMLSSEAANQAGPVTPIDVPEQTGHM